MSSDTPNIPPAEKLVLETITAIVPARNEDPVIEACIESLAAQPEITEILVVNDQSTDRTAEIVEELIVKIPKLRLLETSGPPAGWIGKNNACAIGAKEARGVWLLFTDADAQILPGGVAKALQIAKEKGAGLVSFSPDQVMETWYEKALIPFVYCRLSRKFSFEAASGPHSKVAAANGQFLMIHREAYDTIGGHASVAGEVLEDVAIAKLVKENRFFVWFGSGMGAVRVRMYRTFYAMWEGWKKNLYLLMGGTWLSLLRELESVTPWIVLVVLLAGIKFPIALLVGVWLLIFRQMAYGADLRRNQYPLSLILYYMPAVALYVPVLLASWRAHVKGRVAWKDREYSVEASDTMK